MRAYGQYDVALSASRLLLDVHRDRQHPILIVSMTAPQCSEAADGPAGFHKAGLLHLDTCTTMPMPRLSLDHSLIPGSVRVTVTST